MKSNRTLYAGMVWFVSYVLAICSPVFAAELVGSIYLYNHAGTQPIPLVGYQVYLFESQSQRWLTPSLTDRDGKYAFYNLKDGQYSLIVYSSAALWQQRIWRQPVNQLGMVKPIVVPSIPRIIPHAQAQDLNGSVKIGNKQVQVRQFSIWLEIGPETEVREVTYYFRPSGAPAWEGTGIDVTTGFKYSYRGWGCLTSVRIRIALQDGQIIEGNFKMCEALAQSS